MKKNPKKTTNKSDSERETRVLLEQIRSEVKTIGEQYGDLTNKLGKMDRELQKLGSVLFKLEFGMEKIESRTGTIDTKVDRIESELETVKSAIKDVDIRLGEKVKDHEKRLNKLEVTH